MKVTTSKRLKEIMMKRNLRQVDIIHLCEPYCKKYNVKISKNYISQYVSGKVEPGQRILSILGLALNVNEAWLMGYDVPMERDSLSEYTFNLDELHEFVKDTGMSLKEVATTLSKDELLDLRISTYFNKLNDKGKLEATKRVKELTYIPTYCNDTPEHLKVVAAHNDFADDEEQQRLMQEDLDDL